MVVRVVLAAIFVGSQRFTHERHQGGLAIVQKFRKHDPFLTFTTNLTWPEMTSNLDESQHAHDHLGIACSVLHLKIKKLMHILTHDHIFGEICAHLYSIE